MSTRLAVAVVVPVITVLGVLTASGKAAAALTAIGVCLWGIYTYLWLPAWHVLQRLEKVIGSNGGSTLFQQMSQLKQMVHEQTSATADLDKRVKRIEILVDPAITPPR